MDSMHPIFLVVNGGLPLQGLVVESPSWRNCTFLRNEDLVAIHQEFWWKNKSSCRCVLKFLALLYYIE